MSEPRRLDWADYPDHQLLIAAAEAEAELTGEPVAIPGCLPYREAYAEELCPSVYCPRCQGRRLAAGVPFLEPFAVPRTDYLHPDRERPTNHA